MNAPVSGSPRLFDLVLPPLRLEAGATLPHHIVRGFHWGPMGDDAALAARTLPLPPPAIGTSRVVRRRRATLDQLRPIAEARTKAPRFDERIPTVLIVHALTGDCRAGGPGGFWSPLIGPGEALDPSRQRILCFNLLGSCYGSSGPADEGFPRRTDDTRFAPAPPVDRGPVPAPEDELPATVTTWDQARSILLALDALGLERVTLSIGGSLGGMVVLCLAALDPARFLRILPIAAMESASAWILAWNHVARQNILADPGFPHNVRRGLELARQLAMITFRSEEDLDSKQGRGLAGDGPPDAWSSRRPYRVQTYLEHQGTKLFERFDARSYLSLLDAMDHHDLRRAPLPPEGPERWLWELPEPLDPSPTPRSLSMPECSWGLDRIRAQAIGVGIDTDMLYRPEQTHAWVDRLRARGVDVQSIILPSRHGHDAFLLEWDRLGEILRQALS